MKTISAWQTPSYGKEKHCWAVKIQNDDGTTFISDVYPGCLPEDRHFCAPEIDIPPSLINSCFCGRQISERRKAGLKPFNFDVTTDDIITARENMRNNMSEETLNNLYKKICPNKPYKSIKERIYE